MILTFLLCQLNQQNQWLKKKTADRAGCMVKIFDNGKTSASARWCIARGIVGTEGSGGERREYTGSGTEGAVRGCGGSRLR